MANIILVQFLVWLPLCLGAATNILTQAELGEKKAHDYKERYFPEIEFSHYLGGLTTKDQLYWDSYFGRFLFPEENEFSHFLKDELNAGMNCPDEMLAANLDYIRFSYRLIALSYLIEGQWHMDMASRHFRVKKGCNFNLKNWIKNCRPKGKEMKKFLSLLEQYDPTYEEALPERYSKEEWFKEYRDQKFRYYSHYRFQKECRNCSFDKVDHFFGESCKKDQSLMTQICSENDELYGLAASRDAYSLLVTSNIINSFNQNGQAASCLRRFSEIFRHKEPNYPIFKNLFNVLRTHLKNNYGERFLQGRVFFYGSSKEFEQKGLKNIFIEPQKFVIRELIQDSEPAVVTSTKPALEVDMNKAPIAQTSRPLQNEKPVQRFEIQAIPKSAFLQAAEAVKQSSLRQIAVDMQKLKYDYVFTLNMIQNLSTKLAVFMTREALIEMKNFDKLGTRQSPVPLLFIKYMIDMEEHKGLWNLVSVLGDKFHVSNQIDESFKPQIEFIQLTNDENSGNQWQIHVLKTRSNTTSP
jgi:hypothetical protein